MLQRPFESAQYTSIAFGQRCREAGVRPSMGSVGDCFDNAMCESFFATLECELLARRRCKTQSEARMAVFEFIGGGTTPIAAIPRSTICRQTITRGVTSARLLPQAQHRLANRGNSK